MRRVGHEFGREALAAIADGEGDLAISGAALELDLARALLAAAVPDRVRHAFRKRQQHVVLEFVRNVRVLDLLAGPRMDLFQFIECPRY